MPTYDIIGYPKTRKTRTGYHRDTLRASTGSDRQRNRHAEHFRGVAPACSIWWAWPPFPPSADREVDRVARLELVTFLLP